MTRSQIATRVPCLPRHIGAASLGVLLALAPLAALAQDSGDAPPPAGDVSTAPRSVTARLAGTEGQPLGTATLAETASGQMHLTLTLDGLPEGTRAIHIHETSSCEPPAFESAGGHLAGGHDHGALSSGGMHAGDLPNITVGADGIFQGEVLTSNVTMDQVMDEDGSALVIHADADDYISQPAGNAGDRIACGVFADQ